jgi:hypothetical protein
MAGATWDEHWRDRLLGVGAGSGQTGPKALGFATLAHEPLSTGSIPLLALNNHARIL